MQAAVFHASPRVWADHTADIPDIREIWRPKLFAVKKYGFLEIHWRIGGHNKSHGDSLRRALHTWQLQSFCQIGTVITRKSIAGCKNSSCQKIESWIRPSTQLSCHPKASNTWRGCTTVLLTTWRMENLQAGESTRWTISWWLRQM